MEATEYYNNKLCVRSGWLTGEGIISKSYYDQLVYRGRLEVVRRGGNGRCALVGYDSLPEWIRARVPVPDGGIEDRVRIDIDVRARGFYEGYLLENGEHLPGDRIEEYTLRASAFEMIRRGWERRVAARGRCNGPLGKRDFWKSAVDWWGRCSLEYGIAGYGNIRSLERAFKAYLNGGYGGLIHKGFCNDSARVVSARGQQLLMALWRGQEKPFVGEVARLYGEFVRGEKEFFDKSTGEVFRPEEFRYGDTARRQEISEATVWNYLKDVVNETTVWGDRNGNFEYVNSRRPKHRRKLGLYSLSKVSMDDVALSRKSVRGWIYKYIAVDVVSGYWFRPAYVVGKPTLETVREAFRNMFCELTILGLPTPGELEVEYHLMKEIKWLNEVFPFVRFCESPTEKRAEHAIKSLKYGASKSAGHTRGRWYAKHEAYRAVRNKVEGDFVEPEYQPQTIVADDLADIDRHNNELHPMQKKYPGMTRREVFMKHVNPGLQAVEDWRLLRYIGNETSTSLRNNDWCPVSNGEFELTDFAALERLKPHNYEVQAYWLPDEAGRIDKVYLYQGDTYIGEAVNRGQYAYNENAIERTAEDEAGMLHQQKRVAKFDKFVRGKRADIPVLGIMDRARSEAIAEAVATTVANEDSKNEDLIYSFEDFEMDFAELGKQMI